MTIESHGSIEIGDLVRILARRGNFDGACPVVVEVAERECEVLDVQLAQARVVQGHVEVRRQHTALGRVGGREVEVEDAGSTTAGLIRHTVLLD